MTNTLFLTFLFPEFVVSTVLTRRHYITRTDDIAVPGSVAMLTLGQVIQDVLKSDRSLATLTSMNAAARPVNRVVRKLTYLWLEMLT